ncbi:MAG TPA: tetratricopeptide repeat protein [Candidatus Sumerlaeota bacterium]|nr:tetratricopeptide repeat protein [Candidatus Sumerlaeota bacterium]HOR27750.1 tetratricopeptide repeat protein [Candidatus Sumerlaeota bacterium]
MAKAQRPTANELQRDEVAESLQETLLTLQRNRKKLIAAAIVLILGVIIFTAVRSHRNSVIIESNRLMSDALEGYGRLIQATDETDRQREVDYTLAALDQLHDSHGDTPLGHEALFLKGKIHYELGNWEEAQRAYQQYIDEARTAEQRAQGRIALAYAHENASFSQPNEQARRSELDAALLNFEQAQDAAPDHSYLTYYAMLGEARYYELTGDNERAIAVLERIVNERPAPVAQTDSADEADSPLDTELSEQLRTAVREQESQASFQATAKLRLERLRARAGLEAPEPVTVVETAGGAPAADADAAAPGATQAEPDAADGVSTPEPAPPAASQAAP